MAYEIDHRPEAEYRLYQFNGDNDAARAAQPAPADHGRRAALPDHQGQAGQPPAAAARAAVRAPPRRPRAARTPGGAAPPPTRPPERTAPRRTPAAEAEGPAEGEAGPAGEAAESPKPADGRRVAVAPCRNDSQRTRTFQQLPDGSRRPPEVRTLARQSSSRLERRKGSHSHGSHQHQPGRPHGQPHPRSRAAPLPERHVGVQPAGRRATPAARMTPPASGSTSPTTSTSPSGARRARTAPNTSRRAARSRSTAASSGASGRTSIPAPGAG